MAMQIAALPGSGMGLPRNASWQFGRFLLRPLERVLLVDGQPATLGARAFDVLVALAEGAGLLLTKQQLLDRVWAGLVVEEANLAVQVSSLRKLLGGDIIATIPGRGYRFTAAVTVPAAEAAPAATPAEAVPAAEALPAAVSAAPVAAPASAPVAAPAAPRLLARQQELAQLTTALARPGCVTLAGPSGVGKTTLARALAAADAQGFVWVDLAPLDARPDLAGVLARALGQQVPDDTAELARAVLPRLLVLDNAEVLAEATAEWLGPLMAAVPTLRVLVTSQRVLALHDEQVHRIQPLALPQGDVSDLEQGAVALLVDRIRAADSRQQTGAEALPLLRQIVRRLDGLPLAIEMAAARVPMLGLRGVLEALDSRFALLTTGYRSAPGRHRTLHAALAWSHALLGPEEQRLFRICAVFAGGFSLDLMTAVAADEQHGRWDLIDTLAQLVDRSLVAVSTADPPRYFLLESIREFARERLAENAAENAAEEGVLRRRHAEAIRDLFRQAHAGDETQRQQALAEHDNARDAAAWAARHAPGLAIELNSRVFAVARFATWRRDAGAWLEALAPSVDGPDVTPLQRAHWWLSRADLQLISFDPRSLASAQHAMALCEAQGDELGVFLAMTILVRGATGPSDELRPRCEQMRALLARHPEWPPTAALNYEGAAAIVARIERDVPTELAHRQREVVLAEQIGRRSSADAARTNVVASLHRLKRYEEALVWTRDLVARIGDDGNLNAAFAWDGHLSTLIELGLFAEARAVLPRAVAVLRRCDLPCCTDGTASLLLSEGRSEDAARMLGHIWAAFEGQRAAGAADVVDEHLLRLETRLRAALGDTAYERLMQEGAALSVDEALRLLGVDLPAA